MFYFYFILICCFIVFCSKDQQTVGRLVSEAEVGVGGGGHWNQSHAFCLHFPVQLKECVCACFSFFFASLFLMSCALCFLKVKENYALNMFGTGQFDILAP